MNSLAIESPQAADLQTPPSAAGADLSGNATRVLIKFRHGLGDAVQLTAVLQHLRHYHPDWELDVAALVGKDSAFFGQARHVYRLERDLAPLAEYARVYDLDWLECPTCYASWPSTKAERCLLEVFGLTPLAELCRYQISVRQPATELARRYLERTVKVLPGEDGRYPVVLIHYEGNTSAEQKNLPTELARDLCEEIIASGAVPVILDWDQRSRLADGKRIHNPDALAELWGGTGTGDAEALAALAELSALVVGIDSGPLHVAAATSTPTIGVWTGHYPLHYIGHADNVTHLVPEDHQRLLRGDADAGAAYFHQHYRYQTYADLRHSLLELTRERLGDQSGALVYSRGYWIRVNNITQDLVVVQDVADQDSYRIDQLPMPRPVVVDVGAHIGCFSKRLHERNPLARIFAVECCPENIPALEKNVGGFATVIQAALTYEPDVALLNAVFPRCESTGGSMVVRRAAVEERLAAGAVPDSGAAGPTDYWGDLRPLRTVTLEDLMHQHGLDRIDFLKLDCEGSEFSILRKTPSLDRIGIIVGEYHGRDRFHELIQQRFAGWKLTILKDDPSFGTFWLENPRQPTALAEVRQAPPQGPLSAEAFWQELEDRLHPLDKPAPAGWARCYQTLFTLAQQLRPRTICEIGVRAGYSAYTMLSGAPGARLLGIEGDLDEQVENAHGGRRGFYQHAEQILQGFDFQLLLARSEHLNRLPLADLVYVDGDHTKEGCLRDLRLAARSTDCILVDDYRLVPEVRSACQRFQAEHADFAGREIENGLTGLFLLERRGTGCALPERAASQLARAGCIATQDAVATVTMRPESVRLLGGQAGACANDRAVRLTAKAYDRRYYEEHRDSGLVDYASFGQWQRGYGRWLVEGLNWQGGTILDVGCACGSTAQGILEAGAGSVCGVDLCEHMIRLGRDRFPGLRLEVCDAVHLHHFEAQEFGGVHCTQVAEHWLPELVPLILHELYRVARDDSRLFLCLDTVESCQRQGKIAEQQDPTHVCIQPLAWWREALAAAGWLNVTAALRAVLDNHPLRQTQFAAHDWDYLVCAKLGR